MTLTDSDRVSSVKVAVLQYFIIDDDDDSNTTCERDRERKREGYYVDIKFFAHTNFYQIFTRFGFLLHFLLESKAFSV